MHLTVHFALHNVQSTTVLQQLDGVQRAASAFCDMSISVFELAMHIEGSHHTCPLIHQRQKSAGPASAPGAGATPHVFIPSAAMATSMDRKSSAQAVAKLAKKSSGQNPFAGTELFGSTALPAAASSAGSRAILGKTTF